MKRTYTLYRVSHIATSDWTFIATIEAYNIMDAEDKSEEYMLPNFYYVLVRAT